MILTGNEIKYQVQNKRIDISPYNEEFINPNSYNFRLDNKLIIVPRSIPQDQIRDVQDEIITIPESGYLLEPNTVYLGNTVEVIGSKHYVNSLISRSSIGRLGLSLQMSGESSVLGPAHKWTLVMVVVQPLIIYPYMTIGQASFWQPKGQIQDYKENYSDFNISKLGI